MDLKKWLKRIGIDPAPYASREMLNNVGDWLPANLLPKEDVGTVNIEGLQERLNKVQEDIRVVCEQMDREVEVNRAKVAEMRMKLYQAETENRRKAQELYGARPSVMVVDEYTEYVRDERGF